MTTVQITDNVLADIERHCFSEIRHEVGGVLYGSLNEGGVTVAGALPALKATADQTSVTFTHEVWEEVHARLDNDHPGQRIVGWYHTHPGFGLFLSEYDQFVHKNFFSDPNMVALVVDPVAGELGWFEWQGQKFVKTQTAATGIAATGPVSADTVTQSEVRRSTIRRAAPALLLSGLVLAAGGYFLGSQNQVSSQPERTTAQSPDRDQQLDGAHRTVRSLQDETAKLRAALAAAQADAKRNQATSFSYVVRRGDTLSAIALFLYRDASAFQRIVEANPGLNADILEVGQRIVVPLPRTSGE